MTVDARCGSCDAGVAPGDRFCEACGAELPVLAAAPRLPAVPAAPEGTATSAAGTACAECGGTEDLDGYCGRCGARLAKPGDHREVDLGGAAGVSDRGRRPVNEDAMAVRVSPGLVAAVVCDGVSATPGSDRVAQAAADAAAASLAGDPTEAGHVAAYVAARAAALAVTVPTTPAGPPSCTYLAASVADGGVRVASLGDCRAYWIDGAGARLLTVDHSWAAEEIAAGRSSREEAYADRRSHSITRWIGADADPAWMPDVTAFSPRGRGLLLLCSDGVWTYAHDPAVLARAAGGEGSAADIARRLVAFADGAGGADNITAVVVDVPSQPPAGATPPAPPPEAGAPTATPEAGAPPAAPPTDQGEPPS